MRLDPVEARARFTASPVLRLATADRDGQPHVVPCTFVLDEQVRIAIGIDNKPKSTRNLRRLRNIAENPRVSAIADHYDDDWNQLWWARADGTAAVEQSRAGHRASWRQLISKYPQYRDQVLDGPIILVTIESWSGWAFSDDKDTTHAPATRAGNR
jgi:PPOX class probable F420-dependent enzyme